MTPLTINLKPEVLKVLRRQADIMGISVEEVVERIVCSDIFKHALAELSDDEEWRTP